MIQPIIDIRNLSKKYDQKEILRGIDLTIFPGEVIGYIGPNGAGKSSTVKILMGLTTDFEGTVLIDGLDIRQHPLAVKALIGYVPELAELYELLSPREYLQFIGGLYQLPDALINQRADYFLEAFELGALGDTPMDTFSKGMRQKVLIIAGIIHNPKILVLDEPLSGLDANAVIMVKELISLLAGQGKTIFYSSHMMDVVEKVSDRIILLKGGTIIAQGTFEELKQQEGQSLEQIFATLTVDDSLQLTHSALQRAVESLS